MRIWLSLLVIGRSFATGQPASRISSEVRMCRYRIQAFRTCYIFTTSSSGQLAARMAAITGDFERILRVCAGSAAIFLAFRYRADTGRMSALVFFVSHKNPLSDTTAHRLPNTTTFARPSRATDRSPAAPCGRARFQTRNRGSYPESRPRPDGPRRRGRVRRRPDRPH